MYRINYQIDKHNANILMICIKNGDSWSQLHDEKLEKQAQDIRRRLDVTDAVYAAEYNFQIVMGHCYWLVWHKRHSKNLLVLTGPDDWNTGVPEDYQYLMQVKYMGDHTWQEVIP